MQVTADGGPGQNDVGDLAQRVDRDGARVQAHRAAPAEPGDCVGVGEGQDGVGGGAPGPVGDGESELLRGVVGVDHAAGAQDGRVQVVGADGGGEEGDPADAILLQAHTLPLADQVVGPPGTVGRQVDGGAEDGDAASGEPSGGREGLGGQAVARSVEVAGDGGAVGGDADAVDEVGEGGRSQGSDPARKGFGRTRQDVDSHADDGDRDDGRARARPPRPVTSPAGGCSPPPSLTPAHHSPLRCFTTCRTT
nr:hypothetical protein [Nocardiopsis sp. CNR-923]